MTRLSDGKGVAQRRGVRSRDVGEPAGAPGLEQHKNIIWKNRVSDGLGPTLRRRRKESCLSQSIYRHHRHSFARAFFLPDPSRRVANFLRELHQVYRSSTLGLLGPGSRQKAFVVMGQSM
jgi:hypothetical protein